MPKDHQKKVENTFKSNSDMSNGGDMSKSMSELLDTLSDKEQHALFSDLNEREIKYLTILETAGFNEDKIKELVETYRNMKVSKGRKGRKELVEIATSLGDVFNMKEQGKMDKLKGMIGV